MIIRSTDINDDLGLAKLGFVAAAQALEVEFNCTLTTMWRVEIDPNDQNAFLELAKEESQA
jgi:hypothetical protein